ncbi:hypothetical protein JX265_013151 [Neoarthrinium moseri]|uniref:Uncharacterized protein n=1 Tax=Neoarthrinium moseri TaxID=1658444 RepID=A0A9Q0AIU6_9PEZI|nr:hypothetical protein JX265_013151 [Neoarthrinium moseri]
MGPTLGSLWTQFFPPKPQFTEKDVPNLEGKVYIVSGSNTGVGKHLARILYEKNAKVYIAARSEPKAQRAIAEMRRAAPSSRGDLVFMPLDLNDLTTIKGSVGRFLAAESKLHALFNNAGVMSTETDLVKSKQGYEIHIGVNNLGTFLFTQLLTPILVNTAKTERPNSVRVIWVSSSGTEFRGHERVGVSLDNLDYHNIIPPLDRYAISKAGNWAQGVEFARRHKADGVLSIPLNPGNLASELYRDQGAIFKLFLKLITYPTLFGAYTELYAGISPDITLEMSGTWVIPFGRIYPIRKDLVDATKTEAEGGTGGASKFWEWCEEQVSPYR